MKSQHPALLEAMVCHCVSIYYDFNADISLLPCGIAIKYDFVEKNSAL